MSRGQESWDALEVDCRGHDQGTAGDDERRTTQRTVALHSEGQRRARCRDQNDGDVNRAGERLARDRQPADGPRQRVVSRRRSAGEDHENARREWRSQRDEAEGSPHSSCAGQAGGSQPTLGTVPVRQ